MVANFSKLISSVKSFKRANTGGSTTEHDTFVYELDVPSYLVHTTHTAGETPEKTFKSIQQHKHQQLDGRGTQGTIRPLT